MDAVKDSSHLYEVERRARHAERPGFRISELQLSPTQQVPWHSHTNIQDTFYVLEGRLRLFLRDPKEDVRLAPGETYSVRPGRPHLVTNAGEGRRPSSCSRASASTTTCRWSELSLSARAARMADRWESPPRGRAPTPCAR